MPRLPSAKRYARAAFEIAQEQGQPERWLEDLVAVAEALEDEDLYDYLSAPQVRLEDKLRTLGEVLANVEPLVLNLTSLLTSRGILSLVPRVALEYQRLLDQHRGIERAEVRTATPTEQEAQDRIADRLKEIVGKEVVVTTQVDPSIIGGFVARVGDKLIDGSTRTRLQELRKSLMMGTL